jgi:hypothetical protein
MKMIKIMLYFILIVLISSCGLSGGLSGSYIDQTGMTTYEFHSNGKVSFTIMGIETEVDYEVSGDKVKISSPQGNMILRLQKDGSLTGGMGVVYHK